VFDHRGDVAVHGAALRGDQSKNVYARCGDDTTRDANERGGTVISHALGSRRNSPATRSTRGPIGAEVSNRTIHDFEQSRGFVGKTHPPITRLAETGIVI